MNGGPLKVMSTWDLRMGLPAYFEKENIFKDLEMRSSRTIQVSPESNDKCPHKRKAKEDLGHTQIRTSCDDRGRENSCVVLGQRTAEATRSWKSRGKIPS